jgi:hypothetical protein
MELSNLLRENLLESCGDVDLERQGHYKELYARLEKAAPAEQADLFSEIVIEVSEVFYLEGAAQILKIITDGMK